MSLINALDIAVQGLTAEGMRTKVQANNIANANTPFFVRQIPVVIENTQGSFDNLIARMHSGILQTGVSYGPGGVLMSGTVSDPTPGKRIYQPGHPQADKDGYITLSNVNPMVDMADAMATSHLYDANLSVLSIVKAMDTRALDIGRGQ